MNLKKESPLKKDPEKCIEPQIGIESKDLAMAVSFIFSFVRFISKSMYFLFFVQLFEVNIYILFPYDCNI